MEIYPLTSEVCDQVAHLHMLYLPTSFSGRAGHKLLCEYYYAVCTHRGANGFVAFDNKTLMGFVCGIWDAGELRAVLLRNRLLRLGWWGIYQVLAHPSLIGDFIHRLRIDQGSVQPKEKKGQNRQIELRPIVVAPTARGTGLALQLVRQLITDARYRGFYSMFLYTEPENIGARKLYIKAGFHQTGQQMKRGRVLLSYLQDLRQGVAIQ